MKRYRKSSKSLSPKKQVVVLSRELAAVKSHHAAANQQAITLGFEKQRAVEKASTLEAENAELRRLNDAMVEPIISKFHHVSFGMGRDEMVRHWQITGQLRLAVDVEVGNVHMRPRHPDAAAACIESMARNFARQVYETAMKNITIIQ